MKTAFVLCILAVALCFVTYAQAGNSGACIGCTLAVSLIDQIAYLQHINLEKAVEYWCDALMEDNKIFSAICSGALSSIAKQIEDDFKAGKSPDYSCANTLKMCTDEQVQCQLWKSGWPYAPKIEHIAAMMEQTNAAATPQEKEQQEFRQAQEFFFEFLSTTLRIAEPSDKYQATQPEDVMKFLQGYSAQTEYSKMLIKAVHDLSLQTNDALKGDKDYLNPWVDGDKDGHSTFEQLRGTHWRGRDCDDTDGTIYPGRKDAAGKTADVDHNCNGIVGTNPQTNKSYEDEWCSGQPNYQYVGLGDSATAAFAINPNFLNPHKIVKGTYKDLLPNVMNELDHPYCAAVSGYNGTMCPSLAPSITPFTSVYTFARERNPCVHRNYVNIGVNGAKSTTMQGILEASWKMDKTKDEPAVVFLSLIGNDVCNKHTDVAGMTTEEDYYNAMKSTLNYIAEQLPPQSVVFLGGLVDGTLLYEIMNDKVHPVGMVYRDFYDYLNCHVTSPCSGWLNTDKAIREQTTRHAQKLNAQLKRLAEEEENKHANFKVYYNDIEGMLNDAFAQVKSQGHDMSQLCEPVDSFHPSSTTLSLLAQQYIKRAMTTPGIDVFPQNPNTDKIFSTFGSRLNGY